MSGPPPPPGPPPPAPTKLEHKNATYYVNVSLHADSVAVVDPPLPAGVLLIGKRHVKIEDLKEREVRAAVVAELSDYWFRETFFENAEQLIAAGANFSDICFETKEESNTPMGRIVSDVQMATITLGSNEQKSSSGYSRSLRKLQLERPA